MVAFEPAFDFLAVFVDLGFGFDVAAFALPLFVVSFFFCWPCLSSVKRMLEGALGDGVGLVFDFADMR